MTSFASQETEQHLGWSSARRSLWYHFAFYAQTWRGSVISSFLFPVLYLGSMGLGVGHLVSNHTGLIEGRTYLQFVAPGLLAITAMQIAGGECMWPILGGVKWGRQYHAAMTTPLEPEDLVLGKLGFVGIRMFFTALVYTAVIACFGGLASWWSLVLPMVGVLTGLAFAAPLMAYSSTLESDAPFALVQRFLIVPMFLFSATFYPLNQYPAVLRPVAQLMPLYHGVALCRSAATGHGAPWAVLAHVVTLLALACGGFIMARRTLRKRLIV